MIRNLKIKFVAITMILVSIIIASVFSIILKTNSKAMESQSIDDLKEIISMSLIDLVKATAYTNGSDMKKLQYTSLFVVTLDKNGTILSQIQNNVSIDDESLQKAVKTAFTDKYNVGTIKQMKLRYLKQVTDSYQKIAFIDITREHETLESLLIILIVTGTTALLAFLIISIFLSSWALRPVEIAWLQQKQFIADASHELKTPLTVLLANMDILEENENDTIKNQIKWINSSRQEAMQMKTLLEEMLFLAKTDKNKREITFAKINVSDILISQILSLEVIAFEKNVDINYENVQEDLYINADEKQIQSLFSILLENACKYSNANTVITVTLKKEQDKIKLDINNFGPIIPKTELTHIFERFYRVEKSRNKEHGGYGLGLSIAKKITDNHNMKIWAESNEQKGTSFKIIMNGTNQN